MLCFVLINNVLSFEPFMCLDLFSQCYVYFTEMIVSHCINEFFKWLTVTIANHVANVLECYNLIIDWLICVLSLFSSVL